MSRNTKAIWEAMQVKLRGLEGRGIKVGVLASKGGSAKHTDDLTIIELAAIHEFGSPAAGIPERSFIRATIAKYRAEIAAVQGKLARGLVLGKITPDQGLKILGEWVVAKIRAEITTGDGIPPPLKPRTIARKGSSRPLVHTGRLLGAITYEITGSEPAGGESAP